MRAISGRCSLLHRILLLAFVLSLPSALRAASLANPDFETGDLAGWDARADQLAIEATTNNTFNRNYSARIHGTYEADGWITNSISQTVPIAPGDDLQTVGFVYWKSHSASTSSAAGYLEAVLEGAVGSTPQRWTQPQDGWVFFDLSGTSFGLHNGGFESGSLEAWTAGADDLQVTIERETVYAGNYSLKFEGSWTNGWSFNQTYQVLYLRAGDEIGAQARVNVNVLGAPTNGWAVAGIKLENELTHYARESVIRADAFNTGWSNLAFTAVITNDGFYVFRCMVCGDSTNGTNTCEAYFDNVEVRANPARVDDVGFEQGTNTFRYWVVGNDHLTAEVSSNVVNSGLYSLRMAGAWTGWSFNQAYQVLNLHSGDVVEARGRMYIDELANPTGWLVSGIKLESSDGISDFESVHNANSPTGSWLDMAFTAAITNAGEYVFRAMACGDAEGGTNTCDVYFDDLDLVRYGDPTGDVTSVTLKLSYCGYSGGTGQQSAVDIYFDSATLEGSTANAEPATNIHGYLKGRAEALVQDPSGIIPEVEYPRIYSYGYPGGNSNDLKYASYVEAVVAGWRFRYLTNDVVLTVTNTIHVRRMPGEGPGYMELDQYAYCARFWSTQRGSPLEIDTNEPYFVLGTKDNSGAEFGTGPFPGTHTYVVGTPLENFPRKLVTDYDGQWPTNLNIVFDENFSEYNRNWDKYFRLATVPTNGPASGTKAVKIALNCSDPARTNLSFLTHEIHMGWATEQECYGMVDYPNCTYQDHNEVALRAGWWYGLVDQAGWFIQQVPRGSATIEPIDLYSLRDGNWILKTYEEYLFTWPNAASGVRSIFDDDYTHRVPGPGSYHVGFKIGHQFGTNEFGEPKFPHVVEMRGNGYFRMTDYEGVMGGSFRPVAQDVFGIFHDKEDAPLMPEAYTRLVPRTTPTNLPDDSYAQCFLLARSKTNDWIAGTLEADAHFAPDEVKDSGAYLDIETDTYANKPVVASADGPLAYFAQVDMYWRGGEAVNDYAEGHDFDAIMVQKADGEWVTHLPLHPPTNIYHRTLCSFASNDVAYLMQQDRGPHSYGFSTEAPYRKVSSFEITLLDDGGRQSTLDVYEQNTISEINDNVVVACNMNEDLARGERVHYKYRYRSVYAPGVTILHPNETGGSENWSSNSYTIDFCATDGDDKPLEANVYYGDGKNGGWTLINTGGPIFVPETNHLASCAWDVTSVPSGAYYIKVTARRTDGGKVGFDVSNTRLQVGPTYGFPNNGPTNTTVVTNLFGYLGTNMGFEAGSLAGWAWGGDHLTIAADNTKAYSGSFSARMSGSGWSGWSWNNIQQEVPCVSGETLRVTGKMFIGRLTTTTSNQPYCGIKMESTNDIGRTSTGVEFTVTASTGVWLNVAFERVAPVTGTERLLLWVAGNDCSGADVFFDALAVASTNAGVTVTNQVRLDYWESSPPVDVTGYDALSFWVSAAGPADDAEVWVVDAAGVTNAVALTNYLGGIISLAQRVDVPWSAFAGIDRANVSAIDFRTASTNELDVSGMRSITRPLRTRSEFISVPELDLDGLPHYNPGQTVCHVVTLENTSGLDLTNVTVQMVQEYAENTLWLDSSPGVSARWSEKTRAGDRLCGGFEQVWRGCSIPSGGTLVLTNTYLMPSGRLIDHTKFAIPYSKDWYIFRNYGGAARLHLAVRDVAGAAIYDNDQTAYYSMDDDFDLDNDGLPDTWETQYGGDPTSMRPEDDPDQDGYSNLAEYQAGTDPNDAGSFPGSGSRYTVHLAYTNGIDSFPRATAEQSNFTGAASCWMIARHLNGDSFNQAQQTIYDANTHDPSHDAEITPQSCASWMHDNVVPGYFFAARSRTNLAGALRESVYWMDYVPGPGIRTPVYILSGTNWSYKVLRGFQTDTQPYDGRFGIETSSTFTVYGLWLNDPKVSGLGYNLFATAEEMDQVYRPSEPDGSYWLVAEPPEDTQQLAQTLQQMEASTLVLAPPAPNAALASYLQSLWAAGPARSRYTGDPQPNLFTILPVALKGDEGFTNIFGQVHSTNYYLVNADNPATAYALAAGGARGAASTMYVVKLDPESGAFQQATWDTNPCLYPPIPFEAAVWVAGRSIAPVEGGNLLLNSGFETNTGAGGSAEHWTTGGVAVTEGWAKYSGSWGMAVEAWVRNYGFFYQDYTNGQEGAEYTLSAWLNRDTGFVPGTLELKLEWFGSGMTPLGSTVSNVCAELGGGAWQLLRVVGAAPAGTKVVRCTLWCAGITGSGALKCDDASLTRKVGPVLADAQLVYDPAVDPSPFLPRWRLVFDVGGTRVTNEVAQSYDLGGDEDADGMSDRLELYAGTDPTDALSLLGVDAEGWVRDLAGEQAVIAWPSASNRYYSVVRSTDFLGSFSVIASRLAAVPPVNTYTDRLPAATTYYRVEVE
ncbi:MAG: glucan biosynthesis protein [Verrucomicrobiota bacterium]